MLLISRGGKTVGLHADGFYKWVYKELTIKKTKLTCSRKVLWRDQGTNAIAPFKILFRDLSSTGSLIILIVMCHSVLIKLKDIPVVCEPSEVRETPNKSAGARLCTIKQFCI